MNIGRRETSARAWIGAMTLLLTGGCLAALVQMEAPAAARLGLFVPWWIAFNSLLQARQRC
jgi:hypothetical protein